MLAHLSAGAVDRHVDRFTGECLATRPEGTREVSCSCTASLHAALLLAASLPPNSGWGMCSAAARAYMYVYIRTRARGACARARGGGGGFKLTCARKLFPKTKHLRFCMLCDTHCLCVSCNTAEEVQLISCCGADK